MDLWICFGWPLPHTNTLSHNLSHPHEYYFSISIPICRTPTHRTDETIISVITFQPLHNHMHTDSSLCNDYQQLWWWCDYYIWADRILPLNNISPSVSPWVSQPVSDLHITNPIRVHVLLMPVTTAAEEMHRNWWIVICLVLTDNNDPSWAFSCLDHCFVVLITIWRQIKWIVCISGNLI